MKVIRQKLFGLQAGFSLIELLVTLSVLGILMAVALPNLQSFVVGNRLSSNVNGFIGLINYARSEAIARNQPVLICAKNTGSNACETSEFWAEYEIQVFVDVDGSNTRNTGDILLKIMPAMDTSTTQTRFNRTGTASFIQFGAAGFSQSPASFNIYAIGDATYEAKYGRTVCISRPGRSRVTPLMTSGTCDTF